MVVVCNLKSIKIIYLAEICFSEVSRSACPCTCTVVHCSLFIDKMLKTSAKFLENENWKLNECNLLDEVQL